MALRKKQEKPTQTEIDRFINQGGSSASSKTQPERVRVELRLPKMLLDFLDEQCKQKTGVLSRNQLIVDVLEKYRRNRK